MSTVFKTTEWRHFLFRCNIKDLFVHVENLVESGHSNHKNTINSSGK